MTTAQAAERWGISRRRVAKLCAEGRVKCRKEGRDYWIMQQDKPNAKIGGRPKLR